MYANQQEIHMLTLKNNALYYEIEASNDYEHFIY
jgi:hypothetical protein